MNKIWNVIIADGEIEWVISFSNKEEAERYKEHAIEIVAEDVGAVFAEGEDKASVWVEEAIERGEKVYDTCEEAIEDGADEM